MELLFHFYTKSKIKCDILTPGKHRSRIGLKFHNLHVRHLWSYKNCVHCRLAENQNCVKIHHFLLNSSFSPSPKIVIGFIFTKHWFESLGPFRCQEYVFVTILRTAGCTFRKVSDSARLVRKRACAPSDVARRVTLSQRAPWRTPASTKREHHARTRSSHAPRASDNFTHFHPVLFQDTHKHILGQAVSHFLHGTPLDFLFTKGISGCVKRDGFLFKKVENCLFARHQICFDSIDRQTNQFFDGTGDLDG